MSWISRTYCHNRKVRNELRENQSSNQIFYVRMCQEHTDISETDRILLKIHYKFCQHHCITHWFTVKRQIISVNRITEMSVSENQEKVQREINTDILWLWKISYHKCRCIRKSYESIITTN